MGHKTVVEDNIDVLVAGGGLSGTGAAFEARYWGQDKKIVIAEKANIDRSGAVAQGLYAINCYMGTRFGENNPEDHVRYARIDLMGMVREFQNFSSWVNLPVALPILTLTSWVMSPSICRLLPR